MAGNTGRGRRGGATTELEPLDEGLPEANRRLSEALRALFAGLKTSVRRYATRRHRDAGTISRYLNGRRIPPWEFVLDLLHDAAEGHGGPTGETIGHLRGLHRAALEASGAPQHTIQLLQDQLADNDRRARQWTTYQETLQQALQDRQHRIGDLEMQMRALEAGHARDMADAAGVIARYEEDGRALRAERDRLVEEVGHLREELVHAREQGLLHEQRCQELERQLEAAEADADGDDAALRARHDERAAEAEQRAEMERHRAAQALAHAQELEALLRDAQARLAEQERREAAEQESVGVLLRRGGYVSLTEEAPDLTTAVIGLGWETTGPAQEEFELDASALLVDGQGGVIDDRSFVFYNNLKSPDGSVEHSGDSLDDAEDGDRAQIRVWLPGVPAEAARIVFALTIYDAETRRQTFAQVRHAYIRAVDAASGRQIARYDFENVFAAENAVILGELHRHRTGWRFRATGEGYTSGLFGIARSFGVNV